MHNQIPYWTSTSSYAVQKSRWNSLLHLEGVSSSSNQYFMVQQQPRVHYQDAEQQSILWTEANRFCLVQQPGGVQRKSYNNENRYLYPKPIVGPAKDAPVDSGSIQNIQLVVQLADKFGTLFDSVQQMYLTGDVHVWLPSPTTSLALFLRVSDILMRRPVRLRITVYYTHVHTVTNEHGCQEEARTRYKEYIVSDPFIIQSNIARHQTKQSGLDLMANIAAMQQKLAVDETDAHAIV